MTTARPWCDSRDRGGSVLLSLVAAVALLAPVLNLAVPASSPLHLSSYVLTLIGKYMCYAMLALAVDLVWGYAGILSLGHAAFFALGGYAMGMYLMRQIGTRGVYGHAILPDFMVFLNWDSLPWFWLGFDRLWFAAIDDLPRPRGAGLRVRVAGVPVARHRRLSVDHDAGAHLRADARVLPQRHGFRRQQRVHRLQGPPGLQPAGATTRVVLVEITALALAATYAACRFIVASRAGRVLRAIRDAESRARFLGYRVESYKLAVFVFSALVAGIAGALYVPQVGIINPSEFEPINSIEVVIWVAVGGRGTLVGAAAGAVLVNYAKTYLTGAFPELWLYVLGGIFVLVTLFLPAGVMGLRPLQARAE